MYKNYTQFIKENEFLYENVIDLVEKQILFNNGAKYGQITFLAGGAGSGKGFAREKFMESDKFKVRDVDELKKSFLKMSQITDRHTEIKGLNLKNKNDVATLHAYVKKTGISNKALNLLLSDINVDRLPNIMFDITGKSLKDFDEVIPMLTSVGYELNNVHIVWILSNWKASFQANMRRSRVVPSDIFLTTHRGAADTMLRIIASQRMPSRINGSLHVVLNNRENTIFFEPGEQYKGRTIPNVKTKMIKDFYYITVKHEGKPFRDEGEWKKELFDQIVKNVPGGEETLNYALSAIDKER